MSEDEKILAYAKERGCVSIPQIQKEFGLKYSQARDIVQKFVKGDCLRYDEGINYRYCGDWLKEFEVMHKDDDDEEGGGDYDLDGFDDFDEFDDEDEEDELEEEKLAHFDDDFTPDEFEDVDMDIEFFKLSSGARDVVYDFIKSCPSTSAELIATKIELFMKMKDDRHKAQYYPEVLEWLKNYGPTEFERIKKLILRIV